MPLTAGTPLDVLTVRLDRAGWGDLAAPAVRGLARVLTALSDVLDPRSGAGKVTAHQLAERTCYTERWVRRCLTLLEEAGIIEWHRGGIVNGQPAPSWIRVAKDVLVDLIGVARGKQDEAQQERRAATRRRVAALRTNYTLPRDRKRKRGRSSSGQSHAELSAALLLNKEVPAPTRGAEAPRTDNIAEAPASTDTARSIAAQIRADLAARRASRGRPNSAPTTRAGAEAAALSA